MLSIVALYSLVQSIGATSPVDHAMVAAALTEAPVRDASGQVIGANPAAIGDAGKSRGLWQIHNIHGLTPEQRHDPAFSARWMLQNEFRRAHSEGVARGFTDETLATWMYMRSERPAGWDGPNAPGLLSPPALVFRERWREVGADAMPSYVFPIAGPCSFSDTHWDSNQNGRPDLAVDIFAAHGTGLVAVTDGRCEVVDYPNGGHTVTLYGDDARTYYHAHLVHGTGVSGRVRVGQHIGQVGKTGNAANTPPHCHWAMATRGYGIDNYGQGDLEPWAFLRGLQGQPGPGEEPEDMGRIQTLEELVLATERALDKRGEELATATDYGNGLYGVINTVRGELDAAFILRDKRQTARAWARVQAGRDELARNE